MINRIVATCAEALADVGDGVSVLFGGFGNSGFPNQLAEALRRHTATGLVAIANNAGYGDYGLGGLIRDGKVRKLIASFPNYPEAAAFRERYHRGEIELELVPQGTLVERLRAAGAGLCGFYTPTAAGTELAAGKETRILNGRECVLELPLKADFALIKAHRADRFGNLSYRLATRSFNPIMAMAADIVIAEVEEIAPDGALAPEDVHTPGIFVDRVVRVERFQAPAEPQTGRRG